jgi:orotidine-5'-phosphate decarboxylase
VRAAWRGQLDPQGRLQHTTGPIIVNSSRAILYAADDGSFARAARDAAVRTREVLNAARAG